MLQKFCHWPSRQLKGALWSNSQAGFSLGMDMTKRKVGAEGYKDFSNEE